MLRVSVDFGTSSTCAAVSVDGREPQVVVLDGQPIIPSAVFAGNDGTLFVGQEAERQAAIDPARFEPHPKRRIDERELLLGSSVLKVGDVIREVLRRAVAEARRYADGAAVDQLVVTHPANWGARRGGELRAAATGLSHELALVPEPVAAGVSHATRHGLADGAALAVVDLGGGTVDASVVCQTGSTFRVLATRGDPCFGGSDIDQLLVEHLGRLAAPADPAAWRSLSEGREMPDRRRRRVLRQDVKGAKETLSRHAYTDVPIPPPFTDAHVTRTDLERLIATPLGSAATLVVSALRDSGIPRQRLAGVFLVGGSSRIPLVARLIHERTGVLPTTVDQPETVVARGALCAVRPNSSDGSEGRFSESGRSQATRDVSNDSLSRASTVVMNGSDPTRPVTPPRRKRARRRKPRVIVAGAGVLAVVLVAFWALSSDGSSTAESAHAAQYGYSFEYPVSWRQEPGNPAFFETALAPGPGLSGQDSPGQDSPGQGSPGQGLPESGPPEGNTPRKAVPGVAASSPIAQGNEGIAVRQGKLAYNADTERARAVRELHDQFDALVGAGRKVSGFEDVARFAGRDVVHYREELPSALVDWYVVHSGQSRISVGCRYRPDARAAVESACVRVIESLRVR